MKSLIKRYPHQPLRGQRALVTGASSGIGSGVARFLAAAGAAVAINYSSQREPAEVLAQEIRAVDREAFAVRANVAVEEDVKTMFKEVINRFGQLDILVNNSGLQRDASFVEMTLDDWNTVIGVNLTGQFLCAREAVRDFMKRKKGTIICMSSVHEVIPWAGHVNYAASKGGVMMFMKSLAQELAPNGIRVNSIGPGAIKTPINRNAWESPEAEEKLLELIPAKRVGIVDDIGKAAVWLASEESDYVNGVTLFVDGGMTLYPEFARGG